MADMQMPDSEESSGGFIPAGGGIRPTNYTAQFAGIRRPDTAFFTGVKQADAMQDMLRVNAENVRKQQNQLQMEADIAALHKAPTLDGVQSIILKYPQLSAPYKPIMDAMTEEQQNVKTQQAAEILAPLMAGDREGGIAALAKLKEASKNSGKPTDSVDLMINMVKSAETGEAGDNAVVLGVGLPLAAQLGSNFKQTLEPMIKAWADMKKLPLEQQKIQSEIKKNNQGGPGVTKALQINGRGPAVEVRIMPDGTVFPVGDPNAKPYPQGTQFTAAPPGSVMYPTPPPDLSADVDAIGHYRSAPYSSRAKDRPRLMNEIAKMRKEEGLPPYDETLWDTVERERKAFSGQGKDGHVMSANEVVIAHGVEVLDAVNAAGMDETRVVNAVQQWARNQLGKDVAITDLKTAVKFFSSEVGSALSYQDASEKKALEELYATVKSPASFAQAIKRTISMVANRSVALADRFYRNTSLDPVEEKIIPRSVAESALDTVLGRTKPWMKKFATKLRGNETPAPTAQPLTREQKAAKLRAAGVPEDKIQAALGGK